VAADNVSGTDSEILKRAMPDHLTIDLRMRVDL